MKKLMNINLKKQYLFSFVLVAIIPLVIMLLLLYVPTENLFKKEVIKTDTVKSKQIRDIIDMRASEISGLSVQMSTDKRIREMLYKSLPLDNIINYSFKDVADILATYRASNNFISYIGIYFLRSSSVVTDEGKYTDDDFFKQVLVYDEVDPVITRYRFSKAYFNEYIPMGKISGGAGWAGGRYITFIQSLPIGEKKPFANIIMLVDEKSLLSAIGETKPEHDERVIILGKDGEYIFSKGDNDKLKPDLLDELKEDKDHFTINTPEHQQMAVSRAESDITGWNYIVLSNMDDILSQVNNIRNRALMIAFVSLLITVLLSVLMTKFNYSPWKELVKLITAVYNKPSGGEAYGNEYMYAKGAFEDILKEKELLQNDIEKRKNYIKYYALRNLCMGKNVNKDEIENIDVIFPHKTFCVILVDIDSDARTLRSLLSLIPRLVNIYYDKTTVFCFEDEKGRLCIILNTALEETDILLQQVKSIKSKLSLHLGFLLYAGIGNVYHDTDMLKTAYEEACRALEYAFLKGKDSMVFFPEIQKHIFSTINLPIPSGNPLFNSVKAGDYKACSRLLDEYFDSISDTGSGSVQYMYCLFYNFASVIIRVCEDIHADFGSVFGKSQEQLLDIGRFRNTRQIVDDVYNMYQAMCSYIQKNKSSQSPSLKIQIERFINRRYPDKNTSLIELSDELGYSSSYLSRFINQQFGAGFGDLLNKARLDAAKKLLSSTSKQVNEISAITGYASINSFIRTFKRIEGITPGQYREIIYNTGKKEG